MFLMILCQRWVKRGWPLAIARYEILAPYLYSGVLIAGKGKRSLHDSRVTRYDPQIDKADGAAKEAMWIG